MIAKIALGMSSLSLLLILVSGPGHRLGLWHFKLGIQMVMASGAVALLALLVSLVALLKRTEPRLAIPALVISVLLLGLGISWAHKGRTVPRIHDITTDTENPPQFVAILPLREGAMNPPIYGGFEIARQQREAYPDIRTQVLRMESKVAFERALSAARSLGWELVASDPASGRIEATDTTAWFGFKDDVVIRLQSMGDLDTRIDVRSVSRVGLSDLGTNAQRIRRFFEQLLASG